MQDLKSKFMRDRFLLKEYQAIGFISEKNAKKRMKSYSYKKYSLFIIQLILFISFVSFFLIRYKPWEIIEEILRII